MELRLGELLIESGVLNEAQVAAVLAEQRHSGAPFGLIAERMFDVDPDDVELAWAKQYASLTRTIDPDVEVFDSRAIELITRRQAWQFRVLPVRFDPVELMMATTQAHLRRALRFATNVIGVPVFIVMAEPAALGRALCRHYALPGMTAECVLEDGLDRLIHGAVDEAA